MTPERSDAGSPSDEARPAPVDAPPRVLLERLIEISELVLRARSAHDAFDALVGVMRAALPIAAVALVGRHDAKPLEWCVRGCEASLTRAEVAGGAVAAILRGEAPLTDLTQPVAAWEPLIALPVVDAAGGVESILAVATPPTEEAVYFVAAIARALASVGGHPPFDGGVGMKAAAIAELTGILLSSCDYAATLDVFVRVMGANLGTACAAQIADHAAPLYVVHAPGRSERAVANALAVFADLVERSGAPLEVTRRGGASAPHQATPTSAVLDVLQAGWLICVPISDGGRVLGALSLAGDDEPCSLDVCLELGRRAGRAVANGRRYEAALEAIRERDEVLSTVSHDLKNPLGVILMTTARMLHAAAQPDRRQGGGRGELEAIERSAGRMRDLITNVLDVSVIREGALSVQPRGCDVAAIAARAVDATSEYAVAGGVELADETVASELRVWADPDRITQVLVNLIGNAIAFTSRGGRVSIEAERRADEVIVSVRDTGRGIAPEDLPHVFDRFWQAPGRGETVKQGGSGLGLAICKSLVEVSHGRIWAESAVGSGTRVRFTLPAAV